MLRVRSVVDSSGAAMSWIPAKILYLLVSSFSGMAQTGELKVAFAVALFPPRRKVRGASHS